MKLMMLFLLFMVDYGEFVSRKQRIMRILRIQSCPEYPDLPVMVTKFNKRNFADGKYALNLTLTVKEKLPVKLEAEVSLLKCDLAGTPDSCEYYIRDFNVRNMCEKLDMKNQIWTSSMDKMKPRLHCPVHAENYEMYIIGRNELFKYLPLPTAVWKQKTIILSGHRTILCMNAEIKVMERGI